MNFFYHFFSCIYFTVSLLSFSSHFIFFLGNRNLLGRIVSWSLGVYLVFELNISFDKMEHLEGEKNCQYPMERKPNAYRSMRDYINPQWVSAPSYMVPLATTPYDST